MDLVEFLLLRSGWDRFPLIEFLSDEIEPALMKGLKLRHSSRSDI